MLQLKQLSDEKRVVRLTALATLLELERSGAMKAPETGHFVNNHIHTKFSFSPYYPTGAIWYARAAGLQTAGIMDHDSVSGIDEFYVAGDLCKMPVTSGFEVRVNLADSPFGDRRVNNPDQNGVAYVACHGIPKNRTAQAEAFLGPIRAARNIRNQAMVVRLSELLAPADIFIDFDKDVAPLSRFKEGGSITERHLLFAVSMALVERFGKRGDVVPFLSDKLGVQCSDKVKAQLSDVDNPFYEYDLLGLLKAYLVKDFYIPAKAELPEPRKFIEFVRSIGAISAYAYLGDVGSSVTGDKQTAKYEDDYLDDLFDYLKYTGFDAITYMPSRNTSEQLSRVMALCDKHNFFQISGEDINSPRQSFICPALSKPEYAHLYEATWALIGHERAAAKNPADSFTSPQTAEKYPKMAERVKAFAAMCRERS
ncbi:MAG TPA: PHP domain-containing protein [Oscillospiraceae bacterium]|nr:PHP domain-containing protein [Oscillospiraceae bacterium]HPR76185.1 PHP domain-containing protein [Oscillospiraceae bacterium]